MNPETERFYLRAFYGLLVFHFLIWFSLGMALDLHPDEADHWVWSQYPSWGYYEHPPMIAWVIRFYTFFLGNNQWAMEIGSQSITLLSFLGIFLLARKTFETRTAFLSVLCLEATPMFTVGSMIFIIDTVLILFFLWAALGFWNGYKQENNKAYYFAGLALGLALLSKVTAILFPFSGLLFLLFSRERRKVLRDPHLYAALLLGLIVFSPFIYWNMTHEWISIQGQLEKGLTGGKNWNQVLGFWFGQPLILGPVLFFFFLKGLWAGLKKFKEEDRFAYLVLLTVVPVLFFGLAAFRGKYSDPTWTDIGWPFGAILAGKYFSDRLSKESARKAIWIGGLIFATSWLPISLIATHTLHPFLPVENKNDRSLEMRGWRQLGPAVGQSYERYFPGQRRVFVVTDDYQLGGAVSFYTPQHPVPYSFGKSKRNIWVALDELKRKGAILVCTPENCEQDQAKARSLFSRVEFVSEIPIVRQGQVAKKFRLFYCSN
ncbi:MAG: glycosyltransferase family 39 protein [Deltaproteobacteria bacterium]|nr:glycosyltransferase family 39 protein [Deltaproteobacteria bacterium]